MKHYVASIFVALLDLFVEAVRQMDTRLTMLRKPRGDQGWSRSLILKREFRTKTQTVSSRSDLATSCDQTQSECTRWGQMRRLPSTGRGWNCVGRRQRGRRCDLVDCLSRISCRRGLVCDSFLDTGRRSSDRWRISLRRSISRMILGPSSSSLPSYHWPPSLSSDP